MDFNMPAKREFNDEDILVLLCDF